MIFYSLIGVFLFMGKIENRCRLSKFPINEKWLINEKILNLCGIDECPEE